MSAAHGSLRAAIARVWRRFRPPAILWIGLLALGLRLVRLTFQPLWWDEGWSLYFATTDVGAMLKLTAVDIHPPFYYLLLHLWTLLLGSSPLAVRLLSVLVGTATVPMLYATGRRLLGEKGGLLAAFLLAVSPFHIYYSQEVRMYALVTLLGLAAFYFALRWVADGQDWRLGLGYVLAATAALYTQYYAAFLLLALNLLVLLRPLPLPWGRGRGGGGKLRPSTKSAQENGRLLPWLAAQLAVALLYLPWLWYAADKLLTYVRFKISAEQDPSLGLFTYLGRHLAAFTWGHAEGDLAAWWWLGVLPPVLLIAARFAFRYQGISNLALSKVEGSGNREIGTQPLGFGHWSLAILAVTLASGFVVNLIFPFNPPRLERLLLLALPAYLLLIAAGLLALWQWRRTLALPALGAFLVMGLWSLVFFYATPRYADDDYRPVAQRLRALAQPTDAVVCVHPWQVGYFRAYLPDDETRPALVLTPREALPRERQLWADDPARMAADLDALLAEHGRLWLADHRAMGRVLEAQIDDYLVERAYPTLSEWYGENTVLALFSASEPLTQGVTARFGEWLALEDAALSAGPLESGWGVVTVDLTWVLSAPPADGYSVGLRLVGPTGYVWAQRDAPPQGGLAEFAQMPVGEPQHDHHGLLVPAGTPPGDYRITLRVYRSEDVAVLPATFEGGSGGEVTLGTLRIVRPERPPPVEAVDFEQARVVQFGDRLRLLGYTVTDRASARPGEALEVVLFWETLADPGEDFLPRLQLLDGDQVLAELTEKPVSGIYPTAWWKAGELVRDPHALFLPATVPAGSHPDVALSLIRASDGLALEFEPGETVLKLATIEVVGREHNYTPTMPQHLQLAHFGPSVELTGYDLQSFDFAQDRPPTANSQLPVTLHWHALATPDKNYHTFVHLLDAEGNIVAQADGPPGNGAYPTLGWLPGEYLTDTHVLQLPPDLPPGAYRLGVGLYDPQTNARLGERVLLDQPLQISPSP